MPFVPHLFRRKFVQRSLGAHRFHSEIGKTRTATLELSAPESPYLPSRWTPDARWSPAASLLPSPRDLPRRRRFARSRLFDVFENRVPPTLSASQACAGTFGTHRGAQSTGVLRPMGTRSDGKTAARGALRRPRAVLRGVPRTRGIESVAFRVREGPSGLAAGKLSSEEQGQFLRGLRFRPSRVASSGPASSSFIEPYVRMPMMGSASAPPEDMVKLVA